jgi:hypothetical protein
MQNPFGGQGKAGRGYWWIEPSLRKKVLARRDGQHCEAHPLQLLT